MCLNFFILTSKNALKINPKNKNTSCGVDGEGLSSGTPKTCGHDDRVSKWIT
jgi:hypothetical protein